MGRIIVNLDVEMAKRKMSLGELAERVDLTPAVICNYAYDLACDFNSFYHDLSILNEPDSDKRALRLLLAKNVAKVIQSALSLLGIEVPERM